MKKRVGLGGRHGRPDIDDRQFASPIQGAHQVVHLFDIDGLEHVAGLEHHMPGVFEIVHHPLAAETEQGLSGMVDIAGT
jgi:hypothetical protein